MHQIFNVVKYHVFKLLLKKKESSIIEDSFLINGFSKTRILKTIINTDH